MASTNSIASRKTEKAQHLGRFSLGWWDLDDQAEGLQLGVAALELTLGDSEPSCRATIGCTEFFGDTRPPVIVGRFKIYSGRRAALGRAGR